VVNGLGFFDCASYLLRQSCVDKVVRQRREKYARVSFDSIRQNHRSQKALKVQKIARGFLVRQFLPTRNTGVERESSKGVGPQIDRQESQAGVEHFGQV
jgi:hypothetical protein